MNKIKDTACRFEYDPMYPARAMATNEILKLVREAQDAQTYPDTLITTPELAMDIFAVIEKLDKYREEQVRKLYDLVFELKVRRVPEPIILTK